MFDLLTAERRHPVSATPLIISIAGHAVMLALVVVLPLLYATDTLPRVPTMMVFAASLPEAAPPPPPPPPARPAAVRATEPTPTVRPAAAFAAPVEAPSSITPELPALAAAEVVGGVEGGVVGGVAGGFVGGLVSAPPPPPVSAPPPPPRPAQPVRIGGNVQAPALVKRVEPVYPDIALMAKVTGTVILEASVAADGTVESVRVLRSVKFLDPAAVAAVKQWRYSPLMLNGIPTPFVLAVTLTFSVKEG